MTNAAPARHPSFDAAHLDRLMEAEGIDVLLATSKHSIQYFFDGYKFFFFQAMDAVALLKYTPIFIYKRGALPDAAYVGAALERHEQEVGSLWTPNVFFSAAGAPATVTLAADYIRKIAGDRAVVGMEPSFVPLLWGDELTKTGGALTFKDATFMLDRLRARKRPDEVELLRQASDGVVQSMMAVFAACRPGWTKAQTVHALHREQVSRGLDFDYCLMTAGTSLNRAPSGQVIREGDIMSLDSGGNCRGYIGDVCRMGIMGTPDDELIELLAFVDSVQQASRGPIGEHAAGGRVMEAANALVKGSKHEAYVHFEAHGMGLVTHEAPRIMSFDNNFLCYEACDADSALRPGMVLSLETTMAHPRRGFIKLEDTAIVTADGYEAVGDVGRGWNAIGAGPGV